MSITTAIRPPHPQPPSPPASDSHGSDAPLYLVVVTDPDTTARLPMLAALVALSGGRLLVAMTTPRPGLTTNAAVLWFVTARNRSDGELLVAAVDGQLATLGREYDIVRLKYRGSRSVSRAQHRITIAAARLARRRGARYLRDWFGDGVPEYPAGADRP